MGVCVGVGRTLDVRSVRAAVPLFHHERWGVAPFEQIFETEETEVLVQVSNRSRLFTEGTRPVVQIYGGESRPNNVSTYPTTLLS